MKNDTGSLNPYWILLDNQSTVNMFSNCTQLANTKATDKPINVYSSGGVIHCDTDGTLENIGDVYLHLNGLANILSYVKVKYKHNIPYGGVGGGLTLHTLYKWICFQRRNKGLY